MNAPPECVREPQMRTDKSLFRVTLITVAALSVDNVPEGITTFFSVGNGTWTLPISLVLHNIPEGFALAVPTYLATHSFPKALLVTFMAGFSQIVGGLIGWCMHAGGITVFTPFAEGCMFSVIAGITSVVVLLELLPEAYARATSPAWVSGAWFGGFMLAQGSIILMKQLEFMMMAVGGEEPGFIPGVGAIVPGGANADRFLAPQ